MALNPPHRLDAQDLKALAKAASPKSCQCALGPLYRLGERDGRPLAGTQLDGRGQSS